MRFEYATVIKLAQLAGFVAAYSPDAVHSPTTTSKFRTANYITHGLPQQCLPSSRQPTTTHYDPAVITSNITVIHEGAVVTSFTEVATPVASASPKSTSLVKPSLYSEVPLPSDDSDFPLDNAKFLSFEEWRAQNLAKAGQSTENFGERPVKEPRKRPGSSSNALESLGDDNEIDLDFGFDSNGGGNAEADHRPRNNEKPSEVVAPVWHGRSKLAGKTGKERFNYASFDCAATVHKTNREGKGSSSILVEHKDSYMLNECRAENKFVIVELCDDILVDTIALANFEFFSSMFKQFRVSVSDRYPVKPSGWKVLGMFEGRNSREIQAFLVESPQIWARYLKVEFLTHYGNEFYCPLSLLRVHGTTMMEEFRAQEEAARGLPEDDTEEEVVMITDSSPDPVSELTVPTESPSTATSVHETQILTAEAIARQRQGVKIYQPSLVTNIHGPQPTSDARCRNNILSQLSVHPAQCTVLYTPSPTVPSTPLLSSQLQSPEGSEATLTPGSGSPSAEKSTPGSTRSPAYSKSAEKEGATRVAVEQYSSPTTPQQATPTTQESFYKTIHKRLQLLEANATLSLQYIEDQSRVLREVFAKMERRQMAKTNLFMQLLNSTIITELSDYRQQYDQLWQSTVIELESQRKQSEREMLVVSSRLALLADEVIYQKRMSLIQSVLLLVCILVVIFSKSSQLDAPLIHSIRGRASTLFESPPNSPPLPSKDGTTIRRLLTRRDSSFRRDSMDSSLQSPLQSPTQLQLSPPISELAEPTSISSPPTPTGRRGTDVEDISGDGPADWREFGSDLRVTELAGRRWHRLPSPLGSSATLDDGTDREGDGEEGYKFEHRGIQEVFQGRNGGNLHHNINNTAVLSPPSSPSPPPSMLSSTSSILTNKPRQKARSSTPQPQSSSQDQSQTSPNLGLMSPTSPKSGAQFGHSRSNSNTKNKRKKKK